MIPEPWVFVVLVLGIGRLVRLIGWDDLPPIVRIRNWVVGAHQVTNGSTNARMGVTAEVVTVSMQYRRPTLDHFLHCAFCSGAWVSLAAYLVWVAVGSPGATGDSSWLWYVMVPFALSGAVGLVAKVLDP